MSMCFAIYEEINFNVEIQEFEELAEDFDETYYIWLIASHEFIYIIFLLICS